ncbi:hypothetical protein U9M48_038519, partial [Paspalum notatum var. saurae]
SITPEAEESLMKSQKSANASIENPFHDSGHPPPTTYKNWPSTTSHHDRSAATTAPTMPRPRCCTSTYVTTMWMASVTPAVTAVTQFLSWLCRNRVSGTSIATAKCCGISQMLIWPARSASSGDCPISSSRSSMRMATAKSSSAIHERCRYTPSMWYFLAPKACPQSCTRKPKLKPATTVAAMEKAASSRSPRWPMKACETTLIPYSAIRWKMAGPTMRHSFFDSNHHSTATCLLELVVPSLMAASPSSPCGRSRGAAAAASGSGIAPRYAKNAHEAVGCPVPAV